MMPEIHPDEIELLEYTEGERPEVAAHVESCLDCAEHVRLLTAGREALRGGPMLELPADRHSVILRELPKREKERRIAWRPLAVIVPTAAVIAIVAALAVVNSGGPSQEQAGQAERAGASQDSAGGGAGGGAEASTTAEEQPVPATRLSLDVAGSPREVAAFLRGQGFDARVRRGGVVVRSDDPAGVERALQGRRTGDVRVIVRKP